MYFFEAQNITKQYGTYLALNNVSVHVPKGAIYGLLGPNGAGKTTLIRIINQITGPDSGNILFNNRALKASDVYRIGYLPEERGLYRKMKVGEQALYLSQLKGLSKNESLESLKYWFKKLDIIDWWDKKIEELSKGMAQKIQFVITLLHNPDLLILDEPFSGFDPVNAKSLKNEIIALKKQGKTIILSTHDMASVEELCDYISLINKGRVVLEGNVHEIKQQYKNHQYEVIFKGDRTMFQQVLQNIVDIEKIDDYNNRFRAIISADNANSKTILAPLCNSVEIESFQELLPGMNEVFINAVSQSNTHE